jgi:hypothetical protein
MAPPAKAKIGLLRTIAANSEPWDGALSGVGWLMDNGSEPGKLSSNA